MKLNLPKNQTAEVLHELIMHHDITRGSAITNLGILNITARIANLRIKHDIPVICTKVMTINKFGRGISYGKWSLLERDKEYAVEVYNRINK